MPSEVSNDYFSFQYIRFINKTVNDIKDTYKKGQKFARLENDTIYIVEYSYCL